MTADDLAALHARAFTMPRPWTRAEFADLLASPFVFLVTRDHGFALGRVIADEAELLTIATDPDQRRQGQGRLCLTDFETGAKTRGATSAFLEVAETNSAALALYLGNGWQNSGSRPNYYGAPDGQRITAQILSKTLA